MNGKNHENGVQMKVQVADTSKSGDGELCPGAYMDLPTETRLASLLISTLTLTLISKVICCSKL